MDTSLNDKAYVLRTCWADMTSYGSFRWPESGPVECDDWDPRLECGNGLHGLLWGQGDGFLLDWNPDARWLVVEVSEWIDLDGKVKFPRGTVVHCGTQESATKAIVALGADPAHVVGGAAQVGDGGKAQAGDRGTAQAGDRGTAQVGDGGTAQAGDWGTAQVGDCGTAKAGDRGTAQVGDGGTAQAGDWGTAQVGDGGTAQAGERGTIIIRYWDGKRLRYSVGYVGEDGIEADVPYRLDSNGSFVKAIPA